MNSDIFTWLALCFTHISLHCTHVLIFHPVLFLPQTVPLLLSCYVCAHAHTHTCIHIQLNEDSIHEKKYIHLYFPLLFLPHFSFFSFSKCCLFSFDVCMSIYMYTLIRLYGWKKTCDIEKSEYSIQKIRYELECLSIQIKPYAYIKL